jgi:C4-dicarboxylate-binding protein DctP
MAVTDAGTVAVHVPTPQERAAWQEALRPVYRQFEGRIGSDLLDEARAAAARK